MLSALALAGCGSGSHAKLGQHKTTTQSPSQRAAPSGPGSPSASDAATRVIRGWSEALRRGNVAAAVSYFAVPSIVDNGPPGPLRLTSRTAVEAFNRSLPCGAKLLRTTTVRRYVLAEFALTQRPGAKCDGTGSRAGTAFVIRAGKIVEWRRIAALPPPGSPQPVPPQPAVPQATGPTV